MWETNAWLMHMYFSDVYRTKKAEDRGAHAQYMHEIILGGLLLSPEVAAAAGNPIKMHMTISQMGTRINPYVHTMQSFATVGGGTAWQQWCVLCLKEGRGKKLTTFYCGLCATTATTDEHHKPMKHAYCISSDHQCFAHHVAASFHYQTYHGEVGTRADTESMIHAGSIAGPSYIQGHPRRAHRGKKRASQHP